MNKIIRILFKNILISLLVGVLLLGTYYTVIFAACSIGTATTADIKAGKGADLNCEGWPLKQGTLTAHTPMHTGIQCVYTTGDDGSVDGTMKSYTNNGCGTGTVLDNHTGFCWQKDYNVDTWNNAIDYCNNLSLGGHNDWRLPNVLELLTMFDASCFEQSYGKECTSSADCCGGTCEYDSSWGRYHCQHSWCYEEGMNNAFNWPDYGTFMSSTTETGGSSCMLVNDDLGVWEYGCDDEAFRCVRY